MGNDVSETQNLFLTHCFDCGQEVYFVRNTTYSGCFLADQVEPTWEIYPCWEKQLFNQAKERAECLEDEKRALEEILARPLTDIPRPLDVLYVTGMVFGHIKCGGAAIHR